MLKVVGVNGRKVAQADIEGLAREPQADLVCHPLLAGVPLEECVARVPAPEGKLDPEAGGKRLRKGNPQVLVVMPRVAVGAHVQRGVEPVTPDRFNRCRWSRSSQIPATGRRAGAAGTGGRRCPGQEGREKRSLTYR
jgi:hypothetical protein